MNWRKLHELTPWDERQIFRLAQGSAMRGATSSQDWSRVLSAHKAAPPAPPVTVELARDAVLLRPVAAASQLELGAIAAGIGHFRITNAHDGFDPRLPFRLWPMIGADAFTKSNSWRVPMAVARAGQRHRDGWDRWRAMLAAAPEGAHAVSDLSAMAAQAIGATLTGQEAADFWRANR